MADTTDNRSPLAEIQPHNGVPTLLLDGRPVSALAYVCDAPLYCEGMQEAGVRLGTFVTRAHYAFYPDHPDPHAVAAALTLHDERVQGFIDAWPDVLFFPRIQLEAPHGWAQRHPAEAARYDAGDGCCYPAIRSRKHGVPSWASTLWREHTAAALRGYLEHIRRSPFADRFIGYHLASGTSAEWMAFGSNSGHLIDYSGPGKQAFRTWLREQYRDVDALRGAWRSDHVSFEDAGVPSYARRTAFDGQWLLDPQRDRPLIDYWRFYSRLTTDTIRLLARTVKDATARRAFVGVFYGYVLQLCNEHRQQNAGHMAIRRLLDCPDVDFVASPSHYGDRRIGTGVSAFMSVTESVKLHHKLWYNENDFMSPLGPRGAEDSGADTVEQYSEVQKACFASVLCKGVAQWLMGFDEPWYHHPRLVQLIKRMQEIDTEALAWDRRSANDIAIIVDDDSQLHQPVANVLPAITRTSASKLLVYDLPPRVARCGCGVDWLLLDDLDQARPYRFYIVLNAFALDERKRSLLQWRLCRNGATVLWMYAPGVIRTTPADTGKEPRASARAVDTAGIRDLTGINVRMSREAVPVRIRFEPVAHPLLQRTMTGVQTMGDDTPIAPRFWIDDADATVLARSDHDNRTALAVRAFDDWTSVYLASPLTLDERFVRELARLAGVHVYHEGPDATYIGPGLIGIHAQHDGAKHITLPAHATVRELFANRIVARDADAFTYDMQQYETALFRYEPAP